MQNLGHLLCCEQALLPEKPDDAVQVPVVRGEDLGAAVKHLPQLPCGAWGGGAGRSPQGTPTPGPAPPWGQPQRLPSSAVEVGDQNGPSPH